MKVIDLSGKTAIVTGGAGQIGRALCKGLAECGANVVIGYYSSKDFANELSGQIEKENNVKTTVEKLNKNRQIKELGRLLGGELTDITIKHAEEMINQAHLRKCN